MTRALRRQAPSLRPKRRVWTRRDVRRASTSPAQLEALLSALPSLPRTTLERAVERMVDHLDLIDGDPDFEDGNDAEPEYDGAEPEYAEAPVYGVDQRRPPVNLRIAHEAYLRLVE